MCVILVLGVIILWDVLIVVLGSLFWYESWFGGLMLISLFFVELVKVVFVLLFGLFVEGEELFVVKFGYDFIVCGLLIFFFMW